MAEKLADALSTLARSTQHVIVGDTDHGHNSIPRALSQPAVVDGLAQAGVKHLFLEIPAKLQPHLDMLNDGLATPASFAKVMMELEPRSMRDERSWQALGELSQRAAQQHGIKVYAADERADHVSDFIEATRRGTGIAHPDFETVANYMKRVQPVMQGNQPRGGYRPSCQRRLLIPSHMP